VIWPDVAQPGLQSANGMKIHDLRTRRHSAYPDGAHDVIASTRPVRWAPHAWHNARALEFGPYGRALCCFVWGSSTDVSPIESASRGRHVRWRHH